MKEKSTERLIIFKVTEADVNRLLREKNDQEQQLKVTRAIFPFTIG